MSEWVSVCIPKTLWTPYLNNQWREFHQILVTDVFEFISVLIKLWNQKARNPQILSVVVNCDTVPVPPHSEGIKVIRALADLDSIL